MTNSLWILAAFRKVTHQILPQLCNFINIFVTKIMNKSTAKNFMQWNRNLKPASTGSSITSSNYFSFLASFNATLEDALLADLLIHVRNVSHPDHVAQNANVQRILQTLQMPSKLMNSIITVGNKVDLLPLPEDRNIVRQDGMIPISTRTGTVVGQKI